MQTKDLDLQNLGSNEDWAGNNIALECPVCGKVFIVSKPLHGERHCPACGKSRGMVTGGQGKRWQGFDQVPPFPSS